MAKTKTVMPKGVLTYAFLSRPDKKYKKEHGVFRIAETLPLELAQPIIDGVEARIKELVEAKKAEKVKKDPKFKGKIKISPDRPYEIDEENGTATFKFSTDAAFKAKDSEDIIKRTVPVFESKGGKPMTPERIAGLGNGSQGQVSYTPIDYDVEAKGVGVRFALQAVMVHEYVAFSGGSADSFGFEAEAEDDDTSEGSEEETSDESAAESADDDESGDF